MPYETTENAALPPCSVTVATLYKRTPYVEKCSKVLFIYLFIIALQYNTQLNIQ